MCQITIEKTIKDFESLNSIRHSKIKMIPSLPLPELSADDLSVYSFDSSQDNLSNITASPQRNWDLLNIFGFTETNFPPVRITSNSSVVFAKSTADSNIYAMKISTKKKRIMNEFENRQKLPDSPFLVKIYDIYESQNIAILQVEKCKYDIFKRKLNEDQCWRLLRDIGSALSIIHSLGFIHMDVSPTNILIKETGDFVLSDFGTLIEDSEFTIGCEGSGPYASPEALDSGHNYSVSCSSDIFSFGVTLLEVSTGFFAPRGESEMYHQLRKGEIKLGNMEKVDAFYQCSFSQLFIDLINKMIDPNPENRPSSIQLIEIANYVLQK
ncbi:CAMK family protein kinase [Tritrichomonas foetus]|uniref:CAMK family protein kinase n=1 Tax=Tritrichomonas foetus TaxID=1144522 RepID=A0A1J4KLV5_9EUKA|nr:CAMK family protein kinase [Tritrichomonas foetus]|eukprot:OHT11920.1 CAMK family protein kinase [Tritrichomonas foetus]